MTEAIACLTTINFLEWARTLFDLLKGVAWPLMLGFVVWQFRNELRERIKFLISVGPGGAGFQPPPQPVAASPIEGLSPPEHALRSAQALSRRIEEEARQLPEEERIRNLSIALAVAKFERVFEQIFSSIFGSQIQFLRHLVTVESISAVDADSYFKENLVVLSPDLYSEIGFIGWSRYLFTHQLIKMEGTQLAITQLGRDFLLFVDVNKPDATRLG